MLVCLFGCLLFRCCLQLGICLLLATFWVVVLFVCFIVRLVFDLVLFCVVLIVDALFVFCLL